MPHENYLTAIRDALENGAADLGTLARFVKQQPEPAPVISPPKPRQDYLSLAAAHMRTMADDTAAFAKRLDGTRARLKRMPTSTDPKDLLVLIVGHQTCISSALKAILKLYRQPVAPDLVWPAPPYKDEATLLSAIAQWLDQQSKDLRKVLISQNMKPTKPKAPKPFKSLSAALCDLELSLARMSQDLAYATSQHPRHMVAFKPFAREPSTER